MLANSTKSISKGEWTPLKGFTELEEQLFNSFLIEEELELAEKVRESSRIRRCVCDKFFIDQETEGNPKKKGVSFVVGGKSCER